MRRTPTRVRESRKRALPRVHARVRRPTERPPWRALLAQNARWDEVREATAHCRVGGLGVIEPRDEARVVVVVILQFRSKRQTTVAPRNLIALLGHPMARESHRVGRTRRRKGRPRREDRLAGSDSDRGDRARRASESRVGRQGTSTLVALHDKLASETSRAQRVAIDAARGPFRDSPRGRDAAGHRRAGEAGRGGERRGAAREGNRAARRGRDARHSTRARARATKQGELASPPRPLVHRELDETPFGHASVEAGAAKTDAIPGDRAMPGFGEIRRPSRRGRRRDPRGQGGRRARGRGGRRGSGDGRLSDTSARRCRSERGTRESVSDTARRPCGRHPLSSVGSHAPRELPQKRLVFFFERGAASGPRGRQGAATLLRDASGALLRAQPERAPFHIAGRAAALRSTSWRTNLFQIGRKPRRRRASGRAGRIGKSEGARNDDARWGGDSSGRVVRWRAAAERGQGAVGDGSGSVGRSQAPRTRSGTVESHAVVHENAVRAIRCERIREKSAEALGRIRTGSARGSAEGGEGGSGRVPGGYREREGSEFGWCGWPRTAGGSGGRRSRVVACRKDDVADRCSRAGEVDWPWRIVTMRCGLQSKWIH